MILKIEFEEAIWQKIVDMLATQPYKDAGPLIAAMAQQFEKQRVHRDGEDNIVPMKG